MKKYLSLMMAAAVMLGLFTGCVGAQVHVCPPDGHTPTTDTQAADQAATSSAETTADGSAVKTGLAIVTSAADSKSAAEEDGIAQYDMTMVAVTVDDQGVIDACVIDGVKAGVSFSTKGEITSDLTAEVLTKTELGDSYGMKAYGGAKYEWYEQAQALADYAVGKTVEELRKGAVNEAGKASDVDLASVATIYLGGYVDGIEAAVNNAVHLGAMKGDRLKLAAISSLNKSQDASEEAGLAQLDSDVAALTLNGDVISSCVIDSVQAKVSFDAAGQLTSDVAAPVLTKTQLGDSYGMKAYAGSKYEWYEQIAAFSKYVTGKTLAEVSGIAVGERAEPTDADLASTVTIAIGGYMGLVEKAAK